MTLQHVLDPAIEPLDHTICLGMTGSGQTVLDTEVGAEQVELLPARGPAFAQTEEPVGEFLAIACRD
jgi:hypothetical protein